MKIVVIGTRGFPDVQGGVEKHCEELYPRLAKLGCDVTVITRAPYISEDKRVKEWRGVKFIHLWCSREKSLEALTHSFLGIIKARRLSPDILHMHGLGSTLLAPLTKVLGVKLILTYHGVTYKSALWGTSGKAALMLGERFGVRYADATIAVSRGIKKLINEKYSEVADFIPNGVKMPVLIPPGSELKKWGLEAKRYIFTACRFVPEKGLHDLIEAYRAIDGPPFKLVIAGDADHESAYSLRVKNLAERTEGVVLTGLLTGKRLGELFSNAGLFVLPSYYEGLPIALLEALSYGLPVMVSDIPPHREVPLKSYRYFKAGNLKALSRALLDGISKGITDSEKEGFPPLLEAEYNWDDIALETYKLYQRVLR